MLLALGFNHGGATLAALFCQGADEHQVEARLLRPRIELDDAGVVGVVQKLIKQCRDAADQFDQGGRDDLALKERDTIEVLSAYLPAALESSEVEALIEEALAATGATGPKEMGRVMGWLKPRLQGRADMAAVSAQVRQRLAG